MAANTPRTMRAIWQTTKGYMQLMMERDIWELYINPLQPVAWKDNTLTLAAPNAYVRDWCAIRLNRKIERELRLETGRPDLTVAYIVQEAPRAL